MTSKSSSKNIPKTFLPRIPPPRWGRRGWGPVDASVRWTLATRGGRSGWVGVRRWWVLSILLVTTACAATVTLHPLGWQPGEGQAYFLEITSDELSSIPAMLYLFQFKSGVLVSAPLVELAVPFYREIGVEIPDGQDPSPQWIEAARTCLKPFVEKAGSLRVPGVDRTFTVEASGRLTVKPVPRASAVAMAGQMFTVDVARADRPGLLSKIAEWIVKAGYLPYVIQVEGGVYSLRTGCFVGQAEAIAHAKRLAKTLGLSELKATNDHRTYSQPTALEFPSGVPASVKEEKMVTKWWFWVGLVAMLSIAVLAVLAFLRVGGDQN